MSPFYQRFVPAYIFSTDAAHRTAMPSFVFNLKPDLKDRSLNAVCSILGEATGFSGSTRRFADAGELIEALKLSGIQADRYQSAVAVAKLGNVGSFDIDQNEAQKLSILKTDSTE